MKRAVFSATDYNPGDRKPIEREEVVKELNFNVHKFNNRPRPDKSRVVIFPAFSEFGCESLIPLYLIPNLLSGKYRGHYSIVMGWYGREYLYKHLVDEYWELKEDFQYLREYCRAFHHQSRNLKKTQEEASKLGKVVSDAEIANFFCYPRILNCPKKTKSGKCNGRVSQFRDFQQCQKCGVSLSPEGVFEDCESAKKSAVWLPMPNKEKLEVARQQLPKNPVGVTARGRKCYGRNLSPEFYERLIWLLEDMGYNPVWLGEKVTTIPCPVPRIFDFTRDPKSRDLEQTLAYTANMEFTIQFWTASTRLAGAVGTPYILFESPDQVWGNGQEGYRLHLTSKGPKKLIAAHYKTVMENNTKALKLVESSVRDVLRKDFSTIIGLVENESGVRNMIRSRRNKITWF